MKEIIIMRGIPGSGKSTIAKKQYPSHFVVSADHYFTDADGKYSFDPRQLKTAHGACIQNFLGRVWNNDNVVVDNTNINIEDIAPYVAIGEAFGYYVKILQIDCDPYVAADRNVHGVPKDKVFQMFYKLQSLQLPKRWTVQTLKGE